MVTLRYEGRHLGPRVGVSHGEIVVDAVAKELLILHREGVNVIQNGLQIQTVADRAVPVAQLLERIRIRTFIMK